MRVVSLRPPEELAVALPCVAELALSVSNTGALGPCDDDAEFELALDLILDGLERSSAASSRR